MLKYKEEFKLFFNVMKQKGLENAKSKELPEVYLNYLEKLIDYTIIGGKMTRGLLTVSVIDYFSDLNKSEQIKKEYY